MRTFMLKRIFSLVPSDPDGHPLSENPVGRGDEVLAITIRAELHANRFSKAAS